MRRFEPAAAASDQDLLSLYDADDRPAPAGRPWVMLNMVASLDGATAVDGVSGGLGGTADRQVFGVIRTVPDVIVVAAGTVRAEDYGPPVARPEAVDRRQARGQAPVPVVAVVTGSASLDGSSRLFADHHRPLIITTDDAPADRVAALAPVADIVTAGTTTVDPTAALQVLAARGHQVVLLEGGPTLNGQFVAQGLVDELCLTVAPMLVAGSSKRVAVGGDVAEPLGLTLTHVLEHDNTLLLRYRRPTM
ncbi:MAG: pyrimidine reductase family protein [Acidimicrobiales bacterium]